MSSSKPVLDVRNLQTELLTGSLWKTIVHPLSFSIQPGETLALVGESGSGKSVTANSIMQLLPPSQCRIRGEIHFQGQDLLTLTSRQMRAIRGNRIGMIFQEPMSSLNPVLTIGTQITEVLRTHRHLDASSARAEAIRLLDRVQISSASARLNDYPLHFSGGMRQRVVISIALACKPALLIADEPTTALDVTVQAEILELIKDLQREEDMAALFITHDMGVVAEVADKTLVMYQGREVESALTSRIFRQPLEPYTQRLISSVPKLGDMTGKPSPQPFCRILNYQANSVQEGEPVLRVHNLSQRFPIRQGWLRRLKAFHHAVEQVSFQLRSGETLGLVGESGCGKSTLARTLVRLTAATAGEVMLDDENLLAASERQLFAMRRKIQLIFQDPWESLNPRMRVGEALSEPMLEHGLVEPQQVRGAVEKLLKSVGLEPDMAERFPHQFSGGQRQRLCIARALAVQPKVIIADESVSALDVTVRAEIIDLLMELQQQHAISMVFISHDMAIVERISHRVAVMYQGRIVEIGSRQDVFETPAHPYTRHLLSAVPIADPEIKRKLLAPYPRQSWQRKAINESTLPLRYQHLDNEHYVLQEQ